MSLAQEVNKLLDEMLSVQKQMAELNELESNTELNNTETGAPVTKDFVLNKGQEQLVQIENDLNKITNNGKSCRNLFTNQYYVNNLLMDKAISKANAESDESVANKIMKELQDGQEEHRTQER